LYVPTDADPGDPGSDHPNREEKRFGAIATAYR